MPTEQVPAHAVLILRNRRVVHASQQAGVLCGCSLEELGRMDLAHLLLFFSPSDAKRIEKLVGRVEKGELVEPESRLCLQPREESCVWIDLLVSATTYRGRPALQMVWITHAEPPETRDHLQQDLLQMRVLHNLDLAVLSMQDERESAAFVLRMLPELIPAYSASFVTMLSSPGGEALLLAKDFHFPEAAPWQAGLELAGLDIDLETLKAGLPQVVPDLETLKDRTPLQQGLAARGVKSGLFAPLRWDGELKGILGVLAGSPQAFPAGVIQVVLEVANLLALSIQQVRLKSAEDRRRREAEAMRDVMTALATAGDLNQILEAILVNLHNVIEYDRASLYLVDENERFVVAEQAVHPQRSLGKVFSEHSQLVDQMRSTNKPVIVADIRGDARFEGWPDIETVRGWLGAPLTVDGELVGFLSLGSLTVGSFSQEDGERLQAFADQVAHVLERLWLNEQSQRRTEELEVLSSVTLALGQVEGSENTQFAVLNEIARFSGAQNGVFLFPDRLETNLVVKASLDESLLGLSFPARWDPVWSVYVRGEPVLLGALEVEASEPGMEVVLRIFHQGSSVILIPVRTVSGTFGVLGFGFDSQHPVDDDTLRLCSAVVEVASASLRRSVMLETLEKQVDVRTQHLATLYDINAVAGEPLDLLMILEQVLRILSESLGGGAGAVHFLNPDEGSFQMAVQRGLPLEAVDLFQDLPARGGFWERLAGSTNPLVINDTASEPDLPAAFASLRRPVDRQPVDRRSASAADLPSADGATPLDPPASPDPAAALPSGFPAYIGAPIRAKSEIIGLLSLFDTSILDYTIEDITLFMTVADQIGGLVERARLSKQAEVAAVIQERQRLARELHDSVTQLLYSQVLFAGAGLKVLKQGELGTTKQHLERISQAALQALKEMRLLVYQLRPSDYLDEGLVGALTRRLDSVEKRTGINARLVVEGALSLDESVEMALYRIAEEALNNTLKHAQATGVVISLRAIDSRVILEVSDNGVGFDPHDAANRSQREAGMGLQNMRERTAALGGGIEIKTGPGEGTTVIVEIEVQP